MAALIVPPDQLADPLGLTARRYLLTCMCQREPRLFWRSHQPTVCRLPPPEARQGSALLLHRGLFASPLCFRLIEQIAVVRE